jgi:hypothetical protein
MEWLSLGRLGLCAAPPRALIACVAGLLYSILCHASTAMGPDAIVVVRSSESDAYIFRRIRKAAVAEGMNCYVASDDLLCQFKNESWNAIIVRDENIWIGAQMYYTVKTEKNSARAKKLEATLRRAMESFAQDVRANTQIKAVVWCAWPAKITSKRDMCVGDDLVEK